MSEMIDRAIRCYVDAEIERAERRVYDMVFDGFATDAVARQMRPEDYLSKFIRPKLKRSR